MRELRTELQARRKFFRITLLTFAVHSHPSAGLPPGRKLTGFAGRAFEQSKHVFAKPATLDLKRSATDWIAVAINVERLISRTDDDGNRTARAAFRMPIVLICSERTQHRPA